MESPTLCSPLIKMMNAEDRKERREKNKDRINSYIIEKTPLSPPINTNIDRNEDDSAMSITSTSSSSSLLSPKIIVTSCDDNTEESLSSIITTTTTTTTQIEIKEDSASDNLKLVRSQTNSREKLILVPYGNTGGLLNENKKPFHDVNFCFVCDREGLASPSETKRKNTLNDESSEANPLIKRDRSWSTTRTSSPTKRRPRSTSCIGDVGRGQLYSSIEKTGSRMYGGYFVHIYRKVFLCPQCSEMIERDKSYDNDYIVKITTKARAYFQ